jgi:hypothetical protein
MPSSANLNPAQPSTLRQLRESGWQSKFVERAIHDNFLVALARGNDLFPGLVGDESTVIPETNLAIENLTSPGDASETAAVDLSVRTQNRPAIGG